MSYYWSGSIESNPHWNPAWRAGAKKTGLFIQAKGRHNRIVVNLQLDNNNDEQAIIYRIPSEYVDCEGESTWLYPERIDLQAALSQADLNTIRDNASTHQDYRHAVANHAIINKLYKPIGKVYLNHE